MADNNFGNTDNLSSLKSPVPSDGNDLRSRNLSLQIGRSSAQSERKAPPRIGAPVPNAVRSASDPGEYRRSSAAELAVSSAAEHKASSSGEMRAVSSAPASQAADVPKLPKSEAPARKIAVEKPAPDNSKVVIKDEILPDRTETVPDAAVPEFEDEDEDINAVDGIELFKSSLPQKTQLQNTVSVSEAAAAPAAELDAAEPEPSVSGPLSEDDGDTAEYAAAPPKNVRTVPPAADTRSLKADSRSNYQTKIIENNHKDPYKDENFDTEEIISSEGDDHTDDRNRKAEPSKSASKRSGGTGRDLFIGISYFIFLLVLSGIGINWLLTWKNDLDVRPRVSYEQMIWSEKGDALAFVRTETKLESTGTKQKSAIWISDRFGEKIECINNDIPVGCRLIGWFGDDSKLILASPAVKAPSEASGAGNTNLRETERAPSLTPSSMENLKLNSGKELSLIEIDVKSRQTKVLGTGSADLQAVGSSKERIYFADYANTKKASGHISILSWQPGQASDSLKPSAALPSRQDEPLQVQQVTESPDHNKLGIVISIAKTGIKTDDADNAGGSEAENDAENDTPLGVWIFDKQAERGENPLSWLNLASHKARDLHIVWAKDSQCLGGIAGHSDFMELFAYHSPSDCPAAKLLGLSEGEHITPLLFNSDTDELTFASDHRIDKYNFYMKENRELLSAANLGIEPSNFVISSKSAAAYTATVHNTQNIYICTLNNPNSSMVNITADTAKHTLFYRLVAQLEYAVNYWHNLTTSI